MQVPSAFGSLYLRIGYHHVLCTSTCAYVHVGLQEYMSRCMQNGADIERSGDYAYASNCMCN